MVNSQYSARKNVKSRTLQNRNTHPIKKLNLQKLLHRTYYLVKKFYQSNATKVSKINAVATSIYSWLTHDHPMTNLPTNLWPSYYHPMTVLLPSHDRPTTNPWPTNYQPMTNVLPTYDQPTTNSWLTWSTLDHLNQNITIECISNYSLLCFSGRLLWLQMHMLFVIQNWWTGKFTNDYFGSK